MLTISFDVSGVKLQLANMSRDTRVAAAVALTRGINIARTEAETQMRRVFDRPTPYTLRSLRTTAARAEKLEAVLRINGRDDLGGNVDWSPAELLQHQFEGGARHRKRLEDYLRRVAFLRPNEFIVPGAAAPLDRYGNLSRGATMRIISQLRLGLDPYAWKTTSARSRRNVKKFGRIFWSRGDRGLPRGAWVDQGPPIGVRPLLVVVRQPRYRKRFDLPDITRRSIKRHLPLQFQRALAERMTRRR